VRLSLHPLLYLRSMSYVGHYDKEGVSFATPAIVVEAKQLQRVPVALLAQIRPEKDRVVFSCRVWSFRNCPATINILSHAFVFEGDEKVRKELVVLYCIVLFDICLFVFFWFVCFVCLCVCFACVCCLFVLCWLLVLFVLSV
jgi:hypothetical protein